MAQAMPSGRVERTPKAVAKYIGRDYVESDRLPNEDGVMTGNIYSTIAQKVSVLFDRIPVPVVFQEADPYNDYQDMAETVAQEQQLRVYNQHTDHEFFSHEEQLKFRAVHDWHGHLSADVDFSPAGEFRKWEHMNQYFDKEERWVMFAEVVGQVGAVHYLENGFADERYEQRAFIAPTRWIHMMREAVDA